MKSHSGFAGLTLAAALVVAVSAIAQVPPSSLTSVRIDAGVTVDSITKVYTYRYRITNPLENVLSVSKVFLDVTLPPNSMRPTGSWTLPAGSGFRDPDGPTGISPGGFKYQSWGDFYRARTGLNFVPVGLDAPVTWTRSYAVSPSNKASLLGAAIVAGWLGLSESLDTRSIAPGASLEGFVVTSFGPPGIRSMEFQPSYVDLDEAGQIPSDWYTSEDDNSATRSQKRRLARSLGYVANTVGPTALPTGYTNAILVTRLQGFVDQCSSLLWITDSALTQQLTSLLGQTTAALQQNQAATAKTLLQQFVTAVTSASLVRRRQEASDLLSLNAQFIVDRITVGSSGAPTTAILSPLSSEVALNGTQTLTLSVRSGAGPGFGRVQAVILSGPNAGKAFSGTLTNGQWNFSWVGRAEGTDVVQGHYNGRPPKYVVAGDLELSSTIPCDPSFLDCMDSNSVTVTWTGGPDLTIGHLFPPALKLPDPTNTVTIDETTLNVGTSGAPASKTRYYISTNRILDTSATMLGERDVPSLQPNEVSASTRDFTIPTLAPGVYWIIACADGAVQVAELDETNNCQALEASVVALIDTPSGCEPVTATVTPSGPTSLCPGGSVTLTASQGTSWEWSNGATTQSIVVSESGSYSAMVTVTPGCTATSDSVIVTIADTQPPTITACAAGQTLPAGPACQAVVPDMRSSVTATDNCTNAAGLMVSQSPAPGTSIGLGVTPVTFSVADAVGNVMTCSSTLTVVDTTPPVITACPPEKVISADNTCLGVVPDFTKDVAATDNCTPSSALVVVQTPVAGASIGLGRTPVTLTVRDAAGNSATCVSAVTVVDTTSPAITNPTASPSSLWSPDHKMVDVTVAYGLSDNCTGVVASSLSISCNEPVNGGGDGNTSVDWQVVDSHHVQLRAERSGTGTDRIYTISITARDAAGNISMASVPVTVSHNQ
jgi:hypothetical protein